METSHKLHIPPVRLELPNIEVVASNQITFEFVGDYSRNVKVWQHLDIDNTLYGKLEMNEHVLKTKMMHKIEEGEETSVKSLLNKLNNIESRLENLDQRLQHRLEQIEHQVKYAEIINYNNITREKNKKLLLTDEENEIIWLKNKSGLTPSEYDELLKLGMNFERNIKEVLEYDVKTIDFLCNFYSNLIKIDANATPFVKKATIFDFLGVRITYTPL